MRNGGIEELIKQQTIEAFCRHFESHLEDIQKYQSEQHGKHHAILVAISIIDTLSKTIYPRFGNHKRFVNFVVEFSDWKDSNRVSLVHLSKLLEFVPSPELSELRKYVFECISKWKPGNIISINQDPEIDFLKTKGKELFPSGKFHKPLANPPKYDDSRLTVESLQHCNLLYAYRNSLIHELRIPGFDIGYGKTEPYYINTNKIGSESDEAVWELTYPYNFIINLAITCLDNLKKYLIANNINPYSAFTYGNYWLEELNKFG